MKNIEEQILEMQELINVHLNSLIPRDVEVNFIRDYIELLKLQAFLLVIKELELKK